MGEHTIAQGIPRVPKASPQGALVPAFAAFWTNLWLWSHIIFSLQVWPAVVEGQRSRLAGDGQPHGCIL